MEKNTIKINKKYAFSIVSVFLFIVGALMTSYAFFNYTRTGVNNVMGTGTILFDFYDGSVLTIDNKFPVDGSVASNRDELTFSIRAFSALENGIEFNIYAVYGDDINGKERLDDSVMKLMFIPPANGDGFSITENHFSTAANPTFSNGECLIATGLVAGNTVPITKSYTVAIWIDESKIYISSTTKRAINAEGNPSLADSTAGIIKVDRYIKNDNVLVSTNLFPANADQVGKIIYTTKEYVNSFYSLKIKIVAVDKQ